MYSICSSGLVLVHCFNSRCCCCGFLMLMCIYYLYWFYKVFDCPAALLMCKYVKLVLIRAIIINKCVKSVLLVDGTVTAVVGKKNLLTTFFISPSAIGVDPKNFHFEFGYCMCIKQESWAIAKMTARWALCMGALKICGSPWLRQWLLYQKFLMGFCSDWAYNVHAKFEVRSFTRSWDNRGYPPKLGSLWIRPHSLFSKT